MKKILNKVLRRKAKTPETGGRITNETVAEHRERVLAGGRKFKYPLQYTKHRVLAISLIIVIIATLGFFGFLGWQLYGLQSTDQFTFRITQLLPVPIAKVDGEWVRYSDYMSELRSSIHYLTTKEAVNFNSDDGRRQLEFQKRLALTKATENTLVAKLAREQGLSVSSKELDDFIKQQVSSNRLGVTEDVYRQIIRDYYDWSFDEYKNSVRQQLLRKKVNAKLDTEGRQKMTDFVTRLVQGSEFGALAKEVSEDLISKPTGGDVGFVSMSGEDPSGLIAAAAKLQPGAISETIEGTDGFYIVRLTEKQENGDIRFSKIFVSYKVITNKMAELKAQNKIKEYINIKDLNASGNQ